MIFGPLRHRVDGRLGRYELRVRGSRNVNGKFPSQAPRLDETALVRRPPAVAN